MAKKPMQMRLTPDLVARVERKVPDTGLPLGLVAATDDDRRAVIDKLLGDAPDSGDIWVFAYGSLIWKPGYDWVEERIGLLRGWHRAFCLGWDNRFRGTPERPGLMMAIDRGGACKGVAHRLPPERFMVCLLGLFRREMPVLGDVLPPRWVNVDTADGPVRAITFAINRRSARYINGLSLAEIADALAFATGIWGSMADYLQSTVSHLEHLGIRDRHLWRLQELVAERIEAGPPVRSRPKPQAGN
jgi:cation transport protein ChaC